MKFSRDMYMHFRIPSLQYRACMAVTWQDPAGRWVVFTIARQPQRLDETFFRIYIFLCSQTGFSVSDYY